jgi:hypothetical protein
MTRARQMIVPALVVAVSAAPAGLLAQGQQPSGDSVFRTPEALLTTLYTAVSATPGSPQDWGFVRTFFLEDALFVMRTSRTATSIFSLDGFIGDFQRFMALPGPRQAGFRERVVRTRPWIYRDMAHVLVLYEAHVPGSSRPPQQGVDSFLLVKRDGRWWIAAITNEVVDAEHPVPPELRG